MWLKVGELAQRSGLTVRALHHFDELGLLKPSGRSDAGYRLYNRDDVARLHAIEALRALGIPLKQIGGMLAGDGSDLPAIVQRQLRALDQQIAQAQALRQRLQALNLMLLAGRQPEMDDWLGTLSLMGTYSRYFSVDEVERIVGAWPQVADEWPQVVAALQAARKAGLPTDDAQVQLLTQRWMVLMHRWLGGDFDLMARWGQMYATEPLLRGADGPDPGLVQYVEQASAQRMALWQAHFSLDELALLRPVDPAVAQALAADVQASLAAGDAPNAETTRALARRWLAMLSDAMGGDTQRGQRLAVAYAQAPTLRIGATLPSAAIDHLLAALQAGA